MTLALTEKPSALALFQSGAHCHITAADLPSSSVVWSTLKLKLVDIAHSEREHCLVSVCCWAPLIRLLLCLLTDRLIFIFTSYAILILTYIRENDYTVYSNTLCSVARCCRGCDARVTMTSRWRHAAMATRGTHGVVIIHWTRHVRDNTTSSRTAVDTRTSHGPPRHARHGSDTQLHVNRLNIHSVTDSACCRSRPPWRPVNTLLFPVFRLHRLTICAHWQCVIAAVDSSRCNRPTPCGPALIANNQYIQVGYGTM